MSLESEHAIKATMDVLKRRNILVDIDEWSTDKHRKDDDYTEYDNRKAKRGISITALIIEAANGFVGGRLAIWPTNLSFKSNLWQC